MGPNETEVSKINKNRNVYKACQHSDIPTKIMKLDVLLFNSFISLFVSFEFPNQLKHVDVMPLYKKRLM